MLAEMAYDARLQDAARLASERLKAASGVSEEQRALNWHHYPFGDVINMLDRYPQEPVTATLFRAKSRLEGWRDATYWIIHDRSLGVTGDKYRRLREIEDAAEGAFNILYATLGGDEDET